MSIFQAKVAAITGASSGIGRSLAVALAKRKCHLALSDVDEVGLEQTAELARKSGVKVTTAKVNVADRAEVHAWSEKVLADHKKVNFIFNNAGVALGGTVEGAEYEDYEWILGVNMWGVIHGTKAFLPLLKSSGEIGQVVNISSVFGLFSQPTQSGYNMSKFAVRGFTESLRQELDLEGGLVSATCVHPGGIQTNIARNAKMTQSMSQLTGKNSSEGLRNRFESMFMTTSDSAAETIIKGVEANKRRVLIGPDARVLDVMQRSLPVFYQPIVSRVFKFASSAS